jgi:hypothetical protein
MLDTAIVFADEQSKSTHNTKVRHISEWGMSSRGSYVPLTFDIDLKHYYQSFVFASRMAFAS